MRKLGRIKARHDHRHALRRKIPNVRKKKKKKRMLTGLILAVNRRKRNIIQGNIPSFGTIESNFKNNLQIMIYPVRG